MTADEIRAELLADMLQGLGERYGHAKEDGPPGVAGMLIRFARAWEKAESDAVTVEMPVYPPQDWDDTTEPSG